MSLLVLISALLLDGSLEWGEGTGVAPTAHSHIVPNSGHGDNTGTSSVVAAHGLNGPHI